MQTSATSCLNPAIGGLGKRCRLGSPNGLWGGAPVEFEFGAFYHYKLNDILNMFGCDYSFVYRPNVNSRDVRLGDFTSVQSDFQHLCTDTAILTNPFSP